MRTSSSFSILVGVALTVWAAPPSSAAPGGADGLTVKRVTASSTRAGTSSAPHRPENLTDGNPETSWQPGGATPRFAWVRFDLAKPSRVDGLVITNGDQGRDDADAGFSGIGRVRSAWVLFDDGQAEVIRLDPQRREPRRVFLARAHTTSAVTLVLRDVELGERWNHVALSEVALTGQPAGTDGIDNASGPALSPGSPCGGPGWRPLREAMVTFCGDVRTASQCEDPILDVVLGCHADADLPLPLLDLSSADKSGVVRWAYRGRWFAMQVDMQAGAGGWRVTGLSLADVASR